MAPKTIVHKRKSPKRRRVNDDTGRLRNANIINEGSNSGSSIATRTITNATTTTTTTTTTTNVNQNQIPSLAKLCIRCISRNITKIFSVTLAGQPSETYKTSKYIIEKTLPPHIVAELLSQVLKVQPNIGSPLVAFIRNDIERITIPGPTVISAPVFERLQHHQTLTHLDLSNQRHLKDRQLANGLSKVSTLQTLILRGCINVGDLVVTQVAKNCSRTLQNVNLNFTAVSPKGLLSCFARCPNLETIKLGHVNGLSDTSVQNLIDKTIQFAPGFKNKRPLSKLRCLKLKATSVSDNGLSRFFGLSRSSLERLDISFTEVRKLLFILQKPSKHKEKEEQEKEQEQEQENLGWKLTKLVLNGLSLSHRTIVDLFVYISKLSPDERDRLKYIGLSSIGARSLDPMADSTFTTILPHLQKCQLDRLNLARNPSLGMSFSTWYRFFETVARKLKHLDLSEVTRIMDDLFVPLSLNSDDDGEGHEIPRLETLYLNRLKIDDHAANCIANCTNLKSLHVSGTLFTLDGVKTILEHCPYLNVLDITSCRSIPIIRRRDVFEAWQKGTLMEEEGGQDEEVQDDDIEYDSTESS